MTAPTATLSDKLETAMKAGTQGEWRTFCGQSYTRVYSNPDKSPKSVGSVQIAHIAGPDDDDIRKWNKERWEADATLIADLKNNLPTIISALRSAGL